MSVLKVVVAGLGLYFLVVGSVCMLMPELMAEQLSVSPISVHGLSTIRGDLGGLFIGLAIMSFLGLQRPMMLYAAGILLGAVAIGRVFGFFFDGLSLFTAMLCVIELIFMAILMALASRIQATSVETAPTTDKTT